MIRVLVTGAAGFIGYHTCNKLLQQGFDVAAIDNFDLYYDQSFKERRIKQLSPNKNFKFYRADIRNQTEIAQILQTAKPEVVLHLAARAGVRSHFSAIETYFDLNVKGTLVLLEVMKELGLKNLVFASTSSVYAGIKETPYREDMLFLRPLSAYGISKVSCEHYVRAYSKIYNMNSVVLRVFTCYGPEQRPDMAFHKFALAIKSGQPVVLYDGGMPQRDFTYVEDTSEYFCRAASRINQLGKYQVFNIASSKPVTVKYALELIEKHLGRKAKVVNEPLSKLEPQVTFADNSKAVKAFDYSPRVNIEDGIEKFCDWFKNYVYWWKS